MGLLGALCLGRCLQGANDNSPLGSGAKPAATLQRGMLAGQAERQRGHYPQAIAAFAQVAEAAGQSGNFELRAHALVSAAGCQIRLFDYRRALESSEAALDAALQAKDNTWAGAANGNKATIYSQLGDYSLAEKAAAQSVWYFRTSPRKDFLARALLNYGDIQARLDQQQDSVASFQQAIGVAHAAGAQETEAMAQDHLGESLLEAHQLAGAEKALAEARRLRLRLNDTDALALTEENLAWLAYEKGDYRQALAQINEVLASRSGALSEVPQYWQFELRGQILLALHRKSEALASFSRAVIAADEFRRGALPGDATSTRTVVELHEVYQAYITLAATLSVERHDPRLARQAYDVLVDSRAASLREQLLSSLGREMRLPPRYFELLSQLETTQALVTLGTDPKAWHNNNEKLQQIRLQVADLENKIGMDQNSPSFNQEQSGKSSLSLIQSKLDPRELLLSFCLSRDASFLWAVSHTEMKLYRLPPEDQLAAEASAFSKTIQAGSPSAQQAAFSRDLFGQLSPALMAKKEWLVAADGALLNSVPFSALAGSGARASDEPLIAAHSIRFVPSELLLADAPDEQPARKFLGVGDPIYNMADSRRRRTLTLLPARRQTDSLILARLVGSEREVRTAGKESGEADVEVLTGASASRAKLREALAQPPQLLHFAVHVVSPEGHEAAGPAGAPSTAEAALALSLGPNNMPELLTKEAIASLRVPGTLVVLSGCASQRGENLPSAGLIGLSRAWLLAGASAVVVSAWPTPDDSGKFFSSFYSHLAVQSTDRTNLARRAADALEETQLDMQHSAGYRSSPSFWAAYSLISKE